MRTEELRKRFLEKEWSGITPCEDCPSGHPTCPLCGGIQPGVIMCEAALTLKFGHQKIDQGDYKDNCIYVTIEEEMQWTLEGLDDDRKRQEKKDTCKQEGHVQGDKCSVRFRSKTTTYATIHSYRCSRCAAIYEGKEEKHHPPIVSAS